MDRHSDPADRINTDELVEYLQEAPIRLAVFGEFSAGKTTALNALIGEKILSVAVEPTTAVPTRIRYGREFNIFIERVDGETLALFEDDPPFWTRFVGRRDTLNTLEKQQDTIRDFLQRWTKEGEKAGEVERVIIELPLDWLKGGLELVDTPGVNNEFVRHQGFTEQEAGDADIAVLLMDARQGGAKRTEFEFMNDVQQQVERCIVAPNKMDLIPADEREEFLGYIRETALPKHWEGAVTPPVMGISALAALHPEDYEEPGLVASFEEVRERLETLAREERGKLLLARKGNPEKQLFAQAREREAEGEHDRAHRLYFDLLDVMEAAGLDPTPAEEGISRCEKNLTAQVDALNDLNERYNEAIALAQENPDAALERLESIRGEKEDLRLEDGDLHASIEQLQSRIEKRDAAREKIQQIKAKVEHHRENENWIEAAEKASEMLPFIEDAEFSGEKKTELRQFVQNRLDVRDDWASETWQEVRNRIEELTETKQFIDARDLISDLERVSPYTNFEQKTKEIAKNIKEGAKLENRYQQAVQEAINEAEILYQKKVTSREVERVNSAIEEAKDKYYLLYGKTKSLELSNIKENVLLNINKKIDIASSLLDISKQSPNHERAILLLEYLEERKSGIESKSFDVQKADPSFINNYPDHPGAKSAAEDIMEVSLPLSSPPSRVKELRDALENASHLLKDKEVEDRINLLNSWISIYKWHGKNSIVSLACVSLGVFLFMSFTIASLTGSSGWASALEGSFAGLCLLVVFSSISFFFQYKRPTK